jgi:hypothetical protein
MHGDLPVAGLRLEAADIRFEYRSRKTAIGTISVDVFLPAQESDPAAAPTLADLSLPVFRLSGNLPELSVNRLHLAMHHTTAAGSDNIVSARPLLLEFEAFNLTTRADNHYHLISDAWVQEFSTVTGRLEVDLTPEVLKAEIRFPAAVASPPWLDVQFQQQYQDIKTTTGIEAVFDAVTASSEWLDLILARTSGGSLTHVDGILEMRADFSGQNRQDIEHVSVTGKNLQIESQRGTLDLEVAVLADREDQKLLVTLPAKTAIRFHDTSGWFDEWFASAIPELQRLSRPQANGLLEIDAGSRLVFQSGTNPSVWFNGDANLSLAANNEALKLRVTGIQFETEAPWALASTNASGLLTVNWDENAPFAFTSTDLSLKADHTSLSHTGKLSINNQSIEFTPTSDLKAQFKNLQAQLTTGQSLKSKDLRMQGHSGFDLSLAAPDDPVNFSFSGPLSATSLVVELPADEYSPAMTVTAGELSISADLTSRNGQLVSTGNGTLISSHITPPATSASRLDLTWQELDLINLAGNLTTTTQAFATEIEGEKWSGFNFDISYTLVAGADVNGSGNLRFDNGLNMPIQFAGNTQTGHWNVSVPGTTIRLAQLRGLLRAGHFELPASLKLTDGYIDLQGSAMINDDIMAKMAINGYEMGASIMESSARNARFSFDTEYGQTISANGRFSIEAVALAGGIDMTRIRADLELQNSQTLNLKNLYADVFDGQVHLDSLQFSDTGIKDTTAELTDINLGRLLAFVDIEGLQGTGTLEFSLPLGSDQNGAHVKNGIFSATGPGHIAFKKAGMASGNIGLQALENFQYQVLSGTLDYQSHGDYRIAFHLEGKNPDLYDGHPIIFNLKINGSLPELFEALFMTGDFDEMILKQIKVK